MEINEHKESQEQIAETDERLVKEMARSKKLREIAFQCKSKILVDDRTMSYTGAIVLLLMLPVAVWALTKYVLPHENVHSQEFLFWTGIGLLALLCVVDIIMNFILYKKLNLKSALDEDLTVVKTRFDEFKRSYKTVTIIESVLLLLILVVACAWVCLSVVSMEMSLCVIVILSSALIGALMSWRVYYYLHQILSACDSLVELLEI